MTKGKDIDFICTVCGREWTGYKNLRVCAKWRDGCGGKLRRKTNAERPLQAEVKDGVLSISIGVDTLAFAYQEVLDNAPENIDVKVEVNFTDKVQFAKDVLYEMERETEAGNSPLTDFIDDMMTEAVNQGSTGIEFPERGD